MELNLLSAKILIHILSIIIPITYTAKIIPIHIFFFKK